MKVNLFFAKHPVFKAAELRNFLQTEGSGNLQTCNSLLAYHRKRGRIVMLRKGLYAVVPVGSTQEALPIDPYVAAAKMAEDSVLAYHTALQYHGRAYSQLNRYTFLSAHRTRPVVLQGFDIRRVGYPASLIRIHDEFNGVLTQERQYTKIRVTSLERTMVDVLDRPDLSGGWEETWRSIETIEYFETDKVIDYLHKLDNSTTAAKVGYFLERNREALMIEEKTLVALESYRPKRPHYFQKSKRSSSDKFIARWNLVVPGEIINKTWSEIT